jgi:two-component system sensor histidine kinase KdpD
MSQLEMVTNSHMPLSQRLWFILGLPGLVTLLGALPLPFVTTSTLLLIFQCVVLYVALKADQRTVLLSTLCCFFGFALLQTLPMIDRGISAPEETLTAILFVVIGLLAATIATRLRSQFASLQDQKEFLHQQLELSQELYQLDDATPIPALVTRHFGPLFNHAISFHLGSVEQGGKTRQQLSWDFQPETVLKPAWSQMLASLREQVQGTLIQQAAEHARKEAERRSDEDKLRTSLLSSVSHDLKTPLVTMLGAATSLRDLRADLRGEDADELLSSIIAECERLEAYIQNLLEMTRLGHGKLPLVLDWVSLEEIYHIVEKRLSRQHQTERLHLEVICDLPVLHVHAALVEQGLFNAVDNALKASRPHGQVLLQVRIENGVMRMLVSDEGPGLPASEWERVFNPFYTFSLGDCYDKGTGLGLSICRSIFRVHGGDARIIEAQAPYRHCLCLSLPLPDSTPQTTDHDDDDDDSSHR